MTSLFDIQAWQDATLRAFSRVAEAMIIFVPKLVAAVVLVLVGWLVSRFLRTVVLRIMGRFGLDALAVRLRVTEQLGRAFGPRTPSELLAGFLFWVVFAVFLLMAVNTLGLGAVTATLDRAIAFLPRVFGAAAILVLGLLLGAFTRTLVASGAALGTIAHGARLGAATNLVVVAVAVVLAIEQLGVNTELFVALATAVVAGLTFTMGAAFALGARTVVGHVLAGHFLRQRFAVGESIEVDGFTGVVDRVGPVDTVLRDGDAQLSVPNGTLLERSVRR